MTKFVGDQIGILTTIIGVSLVKGGVIPIRTRSGICYMPFATSDYLPSRRQWHPISNLRVALLRLGGLYDPLTVLVITNQFHERAICLHAAQQALNAFFWQAIPNRDERQLEPPKP